MKVNMTIIFFAAILFLSFSTVNAWAFRCGSGLVSEGDSKRQLLATCGKPMSKEKSCADRQTETKINKKTGKIKRSSKCGEKVDVWYYNCGENDFIYKLIIEDGTITNITTDGRGRGKSDCERK
jgi:hypothetical protein